MPRLCERCEATKAVVQRPKTGSKLCRQCFFDEFEHEVYRTIVDNKLFRRGDRVAIAASGGKDSTVLAHVMTLLNQRHDLGLDLFLLSVDEGIRGYRDDSLETVKRNKDQYQVPLVIVSYKELYGWTMDEIVKQVGLKNNCTFCGVFRRQALDRGAHLMGATKVVTGHNADDIAETVLMNILRGDAPRLARCVDAITGADHALPRSKPFKYTYEKEIVMYAYFKRLDYFCTECVYSPQAYRGFAREFLKDVEAVRPRAILDIILAAEQMSVDLSGVGPLAGDEDGGASAGVVAGAGAAAAAGGSAGAGAGRCERCGYLSSQRLCTACVMLDALARGAPRSALTKHGQADAVAAGDARAAVSGSCAGKGAGGGGGPVSNTCSGGCGGVSGGGAASSGSGCCGTNARPAGRGASGGCGGGSSGDASAGGGCACAADATCAPPAGGTGAEARALAALLGVSPDALEFVARAPVSAAQAQATPAPAAAERPGAGAVGAEATAGALAALAHERRLALERRRRAAAARGVADADVDDATAAAAAAAAAAAGSVTAGVDASPDAVFTFLRNDPSRRGLHASA